MLRQRAKRMSPLVQLAKKSVNEALSYIGMIQKRIDSEHQKEKSLVEYQAEYMRKFQNAGSQGISGLNLQQFESFILQIDTALLRQSQQVQQFTQQLEQAKKVYLKLNQRLKSYENLQSRLNDQALQQEDKQLQKFLDEMGAQLYRLHKGE